MKNIEDIKCPSCNGYKYCKGKVSKGSSVCDDTRGIRSGKIAKRYNYLKRMVGR